MMAAAQEAEEPRRPARKSAPAHPWSHMETMHLLDAYEERWTKLRRGQLKAQQWEDVAAELAARCAASGAGAAAGERKTGTQCRHKLEKLRKRYRIEGARPVASLWPYFRRMERLELGPLPVSSAFPPHAISPPAAAASDEEEDDDNDEEGAEPEEEEEVLLPRNNTRSINGLLRDGSGFGGFISRPPQPQPQPHPPPPAAMLSTAPPRKRIPYEAFQAAAMAAMPDKVKKEEAPVTHPGGGGGPSAQLSAVLRDFGEGLMRLERRRMEVQWEIERGWKETEARHNKMLLDAQRHLHEVIAAAAAAPPTKKARREHGNS